MIGKGKKGQPPRPRASGLFVVPRVTPTTGLYFAESPTEDVFTNLIKRLGEYGQNPPSPAALKHPDTAVNALIQDYNGVIVLIDGDGRKLCYSLNYRNKLPVSFTDRLRSDLGIMPSDTIIWADDVFQDNGKSGLAMEIIWGETRSQPPRPSRTDAAQKWLHPDELSPEELNYLMGKSEEPPP